MLNYKSPGIHSYIFERICQIHDEILMHDREYKELGKVSSELFRRLSLPNFRTRTGRSWMNIAPNS